ncbi:MAG: hypothetical protein Q4G25_12725 [Paracoccus sp. (in: a-proteobacteria)]|nr:hypothetical protein [Paracoccus sp. (in: a-proteobacteria)]
MTDVIKEFWGMLLAGIGALSWLIRLEGRITMNASSIDRLEKQRHEDMLAARESRAATNDALRDVKSELAEMRRDIKELLRHSAG